MGFFDGGIDKTLANSLTGDLKVGLGLHSGLINTSNMSYASTTLGGGLTGAVLGGINGGISDDGTVMGGAFRGAGSGAMLGAGGRFAAKRYAHGAVQNGTAAFENNAFKNAWGMSSLEGIEKNAFGPGNFIDGSFRPTN